VGKKWAHDDIKQKTTKNLTSHIPSEKEKGVAKREANALRINPRVQEKGVPASESKKRNNKPSQTTR